MVLKILIEKIPNQPTLVNCFEQGGWTRWSPGFFPNLKYSVIDVNFLKFLKILFRFGWNFKFWKLPWSISSLHCLVWFDRCILQTLPLTLSLTSNWFPPCSVLNPPAKSWDFPVKLHYRPKWNTLQLYPCLCWHTACKDFFYQLTKHCEQSTSCTPTTQLSLHQWLLSLISWYFCCLCQWLEIPGMLVKCLLFLCLLTQLDGQNSTWLCFKTQISSGQAGRNIGETAFFEE